MTLIPMRIKLEKVSMDTPVEGITEDMAGTNVKGKRRGLNITALVDRARQILLKDRKKISLEV